VAESPVGLVAGAYGVNVVDEENAPVPADVIAATRIQIATPFVNPSSCSFVAFVPVSAVIVDHEDPSLERSIT